jgi:hypothetical protein
MSVPILGKVPSQSEANDACVRMLEEVLEEAKRGTINTIGIACCMKTGFATSITGNKAAELNLAVDVLKAKILKAIDEQQ